MDELKHILEHTRRLIAHNGFASTSLEDISRSCGLPVSVLLDHFKRRENILFILVRQTMHNILRLSKAATVGAKTPAETIERLVRVYINYTENHVEEMIVLAKTMPSHLLDLSAFPHKEFDFLREEYLYLFERAIARGVHEKCFAEVDPANAAKVVLALLHGTGGQLCRDYSLTYLGDEILAFVLKRFAHEASRPSQPAFDQMPEPLAEA